MCERSKVQSSAVLHAPCSHTKYNIIFSLSFPFISPFLSFLFFHPFSSTQALLLPFPFVSTPHAQSLTVTVLRTALVNPWMYTNLKKESGPTPVPAASASVTPPFISSSFSSFSSSSSSPLFFPFLLFFFFPFSLFTEMTRPKKSRATMDLPLAFSASYRAAAAAQDSESMFTVSCRGEREREREREREGERMGRE